MKTLHVELGPRSYPIYIGPGLLGRADLVLPHLNGHQVLVVTNEVVAPLYLERALAAFARLETTTVVLPDGEAHKNLESLTRVFDALLEHQHARDTTVVALGGGVVGDLAGFAAATYQRGVAFVQMPTTLLAQVDSSVGGKTGVNHPRGKNMIGAFHQPSCVVVDTDALMTLDDRQLGAGVAEVIKYGLIRDLDFFLWLEDHVEGVLRRDADALTAAIERSCWNKAQVVASDEREAGVRALLNLGHTFGHAIETGLGYGEWLHGEAVGAGMCLAADLSARQGWLAPGDRERVYALVNRAGLPTRPPSGFGSDRFLDLMAVDKKVRDGRLRLVLLRDIGEAVLTDDFDPGLLRATLEAG